MVGSLSRQPLCLEQRNGGAMPLTARSLQSASMEQDLQISTILALPTEPIRTERSFWEAKLCLARPLRAVLSAMARCSLFTPMEAVLQIFIISRPTRTVVRTGI